MMKCDICGETAETKRIGLRNVCEDCEVKYLRGYTKDYAEEFIKQDETEFLRFWWDDLSTDEQNRFLKVIFELFKWKDKEQAHFEMISFCRESELFPEFVEEKLNLE